MNVFGNLYKPNKKGDSKPACITDIFYYVSLTVFFKWLQFLKHPVESSEN